MEINNLKFQLSATSAGTDVLIKIDDTIVWQGDPCGQREVLCDLSNIPDGDHKLEICLSGKTEQDTIVDDNGNIIQDLLVSVNGITLDTVDISQKFWESSKYHHDFNGSQPAIVDEFFGDMGCNGRVEFVFSTPSYLWILENI